MGEYAVHIYIDKYMGKPSREVLTPLLRLSGPTQSGLIGPLLYSPFRISPVCFGGILAAHLYVGASPDFLVLQTDLHVPAQTLEPFSAE